MNNNDNLKSLYNTLQKEGYTPPAFEQFVKDMEDDNNLRGVYSTLQKEGYTPPDYDTFRNDMGFGNDNPIDLTAATEGVGVGAEAVDNVINKNAPTSGNAGIHAQQVVDEYDRSAGNMPGNAQITTNEKQPQKGEVQRGTQQTLQQPRPAAGQAQKQGVRTQFVPEYSNVKGFTVAKDSPLRQRYPFLNQLGENEQAFFRTDTNEPLYSWKDRQGREITPEEAALLNQRAEIEQNEAVRPYQVPLTSLQLPEVKTRGIRTDTSITSYVDAELQREYGKDYLNKEITLTNGKKVSGSEMLSNVSQQIYSNLNKQINEARITYASADEADKKLIIKQFADNYKGLLSEATVKRALEEHNALQDAEKESEERMRAEWKQMQKDNPGFWKTLKNSVGSGFVRLGAGLLDTMQQLASGMLIEDPSRKEGYFRTRSYEEALADMNDPLTIATRALHDKADRLSKSAQPYKGKKSFLDMLWDGEITQFLQKGVATAGESLPMTLSAFNPFTMTLNAISMAGSNFRQNTLENPDIPVWKRAAQAIGSAAIEQAVERYADPIFKYIGGRNILKGVSKENSERIVNEITEDATNILAERIYGRLRNITKDAAGEGAEEVVTNVGNDALGEALDLISGDTDYGLRAQWEKYKEENPTSSLRDFAKEKAKENIESFIGGAMAGAYTSTTTQLSVKALQYSFDKIGGERNVTDHTRLNPVQVDIAQSYDDGYNFKDDNELQNTKSSYEQQRLNIENIFSQEQVEAIDKDPVTELSNSKDLSDEKRQAVVDYVNAKAKYDGMMQRLHDDEENGIDHRNLHVDDGMIHTALLYPTAENDGEPQEVFITRGNVVMRDDGTVDTEASSNEIYYKSSDGQTHIASPDKFQSVNEPISVEEYANANAELTMNNEKLNIGNEEEQYAVGDEVNVNIDGNNYTATVQGDDGNGNVSVYYQNADGMDVPATFTVEELRNMNKPDVEHTNVADEYSQFVDTGVVSDDTVTRIAEKIINGQQLTPEEASMRLGAAQRVEDILKERQGMMQPNGFAENSTENVAENGGNSTENGNIETQNVPASALERIPKDEQGQPIYEHADPDTAWDAIVEQSGGDEEITGEVVADLVAEHDKALKAAEKELKKVQEGKPQQKKSDAPLTMDERIAAKKAAKEQLSQAQANVERAKTNLAFWQKIAQTPQRRKQAALAEQSKAAEEAARLRRAEEEKLRAEREEAEHIRREALKGVPDFVDDTPQDARARGYRRVNGEKVDRQQTIPTRQGKEVQVKFDDKNIPTGHVTLIDASQLQPSHINGQRNPLHFIDEAQPKERNDEASVMSARKIAANIRPEEITSSVTAYTGAPTVNSRGEVIQGNNRSAALREMWAGEPEQAAIYTQYLIDHAVDFGLVPEDVEAMQQPVLVNMLDVPDEDAITLGQFVASDTESGGIERIKPKNIVQKMGGDMRSFANQLLASPDEEMSFAELVDRNGLAVLKWMQRKGYITPTQYKSAFDSKNNLTAEAKNDLKGVMYQSIFQNGNTHLEEMFNALPVKAQKAILATAYRDYDSPNSERMIEEIQNSISVYYALSQDPAFAGAKNYKEARIAAESWKRQLAFDDVTGESYLPAEKYSNFALLLATMYKGQTQTFIQNTFKNIFDLVQGTQEATLFDEPDNTPRTLADAINETLSNLREELLLNGNFIYNGQRRNNVLAGSGTTGQQRGQGSDGSSQTGGRAENSERAADGNRGTEVSGEQGQIEGRNDSQLERNSASKQEEYTLSSKLSGNGEPFYQDADGNIDLVDIPQKVFDEIGYSKAPFRLTPSMILHVLNGHGKELGVSTVEETVHFVLDVMKNFDHIRLGYDGALIFSIENGRKRIGKRSVTILINSDNGKFYGLKTSGYETVKGLNKRPLLWERGANEVSSTTDAASASVPTGKSPLSGEQSGSASHQSKSPSETVAKTEPQQPNNAVSTGSSLFENEEGGITSSEPNGKPTVSESKDSKKTAIISDLGEKVAKAEEEIERREAELASRIEVGDDYLRKDNGEYPTYERRIIIDGKHIALQVDEPNKKGEYTGSYFEFDNKRFGSVAEVVDYIDNGHTLASKIAQAEAETDTEPTEAQKEAGNYKKGHVRIGQFDITVENPKGSVRRGIDANGKAWEQEMRNTYGYIRGTEGVDGDHIDVFLTNYIDGWNGRRVYIVDQYNEDGTFDEHKVMLGFNDEAEAQDAYLSNYEKGWSFKHKLVLSSANLEEFEKWINSSHRKTKPFAEYKSVNNNETHAMSGFDITPTQYTTKRGRVLDMQLVKFSNPLTKEQKQAARELAKKEKGWYDRDKDGFMMRSKESAQKLVDTVLGIEETVADAQPLSLTDIRKLEEPVIRKVDVEGLIRDINQNGEAKLSDHYVPLSEQEDNISDETIKALHEAVGVDIDKLKDFINDENISEQNINEYNRFGSLIETVNREKARAFLSKKEAKEIPAYLVIPKIDALLRDFIIHPENRKNILENSKTEAQETEPQPQKSDNNDYGANNKFVNREEYEETRANLRKIIYGQLNLGLPPQALIMGMKMAMFHIEAGAREFADYATHMIADLGDAIRPYLKSFYEAARNLPEAEESGLAGEMTPSEEVRTFDVANFDKPTVNALDTAQMVVQEQEANKQAESAKNALTEQRNKQRRKERQKKQEKPKIADLFSGQQGETTNESKDDKSKNTATTNAENTEINRKFADAVKTDMLVAIDSGTKPYRSILDLRKRAAGLGMEVDNDGRTDILLQELVENGLVRAAREVAERHGSDSKETYDLICKLYEMQPTIAARSSNRIKMQQYSTPLPMAWNATHFAMAGKKGGKVLEPTAGNGMLVFAIPAGQVHANELDGTRLANLREQGFAQVTQQDATEPFEGGKQYDVVIANPPFGKREAADYDGKLISGLDPQITLNALASMKDDGKAAIIIGGNMEYAKNGAINNMKPFFTYLYDHYNVKGVVDMDGSLYAKQGTTYPTRMILIDGRRSEEERAQTAVYPPVESKAIRRAESFDDLYEIVNEVLNSKVKTNGTEVLRGRGGQLLPITDQSSGDTDGKRHTGQPRKNDTGGRGGRTPVERTQEPGEVVLRGEHRENTGNGETGRETGGNTAGGSRGISEPDVQRVGTVGVSTDRVGLEPQRTLEQPKKRGLSEEKLPYRPHNTAFSLQSVAPAAMVEAMDRTLSQIEKKHGNIDEFVRKELGYDTTNELHQALAAEQVDSVAMAIYQMKQGQALIIGDQTGVGKGRQMAALIRWAVRQGEKPIFITQKADLFSDIYRDLVDIGSGDLVPFIFNSPSAKENKGEMVDANGKVVYKGLSDAKMKKVLATGKLPDEYDYAVLTYSQVNTGDEVSQKEMEEAAKKNKTRSKKSKSAKNGKATPKATFLRTIAEDNYLFLDESHTAAGSSNTGAYLQSILRSAKAATFASATFAKRPDTMPLYAIRTAMSQAKVEPDKLISIIEKGGVTLQEIMSRELTNAGQMVRRERDMSDVVTDWKTINDPETVRRARENYDRTIAAFNAIIKFQEDYVKPMVDAMDQELAVMAESAGIKRGTDKLGVDNVPFASKTYNYTKQLMLALKVDAIANEVDAEIKAGRHPVIALESTMESSIKDYSAGEVIAEPTFSASLLRGLDTVMQYTIKDENGKEQHARYSPKQLGEAGEKAYYELQDFIRESTSDIFISPIDAIIERLHEMGYKVGELTGRDKYVELDNEGRAVVRKRTDKDKKRMQREFNNGELDVLILNKSASTGISLHASEKFSDQRQRTMIIAQPLSDINDYMQMIGRIDRTGQVHRGYYINLGLPVPAENRFLMMLSTKLKSLNANTTTSQDSESNEVEAPDLLNKYGSQVVVEYLRDNPDIYEKMGRPLKKNGEKGGTVSIAELDEYKPQEDDARKITGYVALLTTQEQEEFYDDVVRRYNELIKYLNDTGNNDLKITVMPLRAKTLEKRVSSEGIDPTGANPFAQNSYVEQVEMDVLRKPMKAAEVRKTIEQVNKGERPEDYIRQVISAIEKEDEARIAAEEARYERSKVRAQEDIAKQTEKINRQQKRSAEEKQAAIADYVKETNENVETKHSDNLMRLNTNSDMLKQRLHMFDVGMSYLMPDNLESMVFDFSTPAIFCGYKAKDSKVTASTTFAVFATLDGRRRVEVKLSDIAALRNIYMATNDNWDAARSTTLENWDSQIPTSTRKTGYIMTGNILQAIADTQDERGGFPGQLISYTDIDGNVHDGILMPDKWNTSMLRTSGAPIISRLKQIKDYMPVTSHDGKVEITGSSWAKMYYMTVPKTKKDGAVYYENKTLLRAVNGGNFYPYRGKLRADIPAEHIESVVKELSRLGVKVKEDFNDGDVLYRNASEELNEVNGRFNEELTGLTEENADKVVFSLGRPSTILRAAGVEDKPLKLYGNKVIKKMKKHGFKLGELHNLPEAVANPIAVFNNYQKEGNRSILTEMTVGDKNILVSITVGQGNDVDFNIISSVFGKGKSNIIDWINKGYATYIDKKKILDYLHISGSSISEASNSRENDTNQVRLSSAKSNSQAIANKTLVSAANIVRNFENPSVSDENMRFGNGELTDDELSYANDPVAKMTGRSPRTAAQRRAFAERERQYMVQRIQELAETLHLDNVDIVTDASTLQGNRAKAQGFFSRSTGRITIVIPNQTSVFDAEQTLLHEAVAHYGLRELFGEHFDTFLDNVFQNADTDVRRHIVELAERRGWDFRTATEEYLASLAENTNFENINASWWSKIKELFLRMLHKIGFEDFSGVTLSDNELRYILWRSYENLAEPGRYRSIIGEVRDMAKQHELNVGNYKTTKEKAQEFLFHQSAPIAATAANSELISAANVVKNFENPSVESENVDKDVLYRMAEDAENDLRKNWQEEYDRRTTGAGFNFTEASQDDMRSVKMLQKTVAEETGRPITANEDADALQNRLSSTNHIEEGYYEYNYFRPIIKAVANLVKMGASYNDKGRDIIKADKDVLKYIIAKSGLERNAKFRERDAEAELQRIISPMEDKINNGFMDKDEREAMRKRVELEKAKYNGVKETLGEENANKWYDKERKKLDTLKANNNIKIKDYDKRVAKLDTEYNYGWKTTFNRDYSGLTELFGKDDFDVKAQEYVERFEGDFKDLTGELWKTINNATKATLRKAYESGLISRKQYEDTRDMFNYYVPLRSWSNDSASEMYNYRKDDSGRPGKLLKHAFGRTSLADNPLAMIATMAQSTIMQGNKNKVKQRLYNLAVSHNTSLLSVDRQWYENKGTDDNPKWERAYPELNGEMGAEEVAAALENFEQRMQQLKEQGRARRNRQGLTLAYHTTRNESLQHRVSVSIGGREYNIYVNGNPRAAQALNGELRDDESKGVIAAVHRWLSKVYTSHNPEFTVGNYQRDSGLAAAIVAATEDKDYQLPWAKNMALFNPFTSGLYLNALINGTIKGKNDLGTAYNAISNGINKTLKNGTVEQYMHEFLFNGGETGFTNVLTVDQYKKKMRRDIKDINTMITPRKAQKAVSAWMERCNRVFEDATRFATYVTSREQGRDVNRSIRDAKEISLNFNTRGADGLKNDSIFHKFFRGLRRWYIFTNPNIQALEKVGRAFATNPKRSALYLAGIPVLLGYSIAKLIQVGLDGDDDDERVKAYKDLPEWIRRSNICIPVGGTKFVTVPLSYELRISYGLGEMLWEMEQGDITPDKAALEIATQLSDLLPVSLASGSVYHNLAPSGLAPIVDVAINENYMGIPIWSENGFNENMPAYSKAFAGTEKWLVKSAEVANSLIPDPRLKDSPTPDKYTPGLFNVNPGMIEHLLDNYFGGWFTFPMKAKRFVQGYMLGDEDVKDIRNIPFVSRNLKDSKTGSMLNRSQGDRYWIYMNEYELNDQRRRGYTKEAEHGVPEFIKKVTELYDSPGGQRMMIIKGYKKTFDKIDRRISEIDEFGSPDGKDKAEREELKNASDSLKSEMVDILDGITNGTIMFKEGKIVRMPEPFENN